MPNEEFPTMPFGLDKSLMAELPGGNSKKKLDSFRKVGYVYCCLCFEQ